MIANEIQAVNLSKTMTLSPKVAIIGAGPSGSTLARLLVLASIPVTVFEGETSISVRGQGGTLDLHTDTGLKALREAELYEEYTKYARYDGEAINVMDKNMKSYIRLGGTTEATSRGRPEIDRERLREILLQSLPAGTIRWNCRLRKIDAKDLSLHFDHGVERGFDLIVGADGAWSKVRPAVSDVKPQYAGIGGYDLYLDNVEERHPDLHKLVNRGSIFAVSDGKGITAQQKGDGSLIIYATSTRDEKWMETCGYDVHNPAEIKKALAKEYSDWAEPLQKITQAANDKDPTPRCLYTLPIGHRWNHRAGVTLIGDAAHLMTPHAGEGVNVAMKDALNLAKAIIRSAKRDQTSSILDQEVKSFEEEMFKRAEPVARVSQANGEDMFFTPGAPNTIIAKWVRRALSDHWLVKLLVPLWFVRAVLRVVFWW